MRQPRAALILALAGPIAYRAPDSNSRQVDTMAVAGEVTTFVVDPVAGGARVSFTTELDARGGIVGLLERSVVSWFLGRVYRAELARLDDYVRN